MCDVAITCGAAPVSSSISAPAPAPAPAPSNENDILTCPSAERFTSPASRFIPARTDEEDDDDDAAAEEEAAGSGTGTGSVKVACRWRYDSVGTGAVFNIS